MTVGQLRDTRGPCAVLHARPSRFWLRSGLGSRFAYFRARALLSAALAVLAVSDVHAKPDASAKGASAPQAQTESGGEAQGKPGAKESNGTKPADEKAAKAKQRFDIDEYRVEGAEALPQIEVEEAVYPFLGPNRTEADVEKARAALEKAYHDKGLQTVSVSVPPQNALRGFVVLKVTENKVGQLRVKGSRYFDLDKIKETAPSLQKGTLPNFKEVTKDIVTLNRWPDRRVTPALRAGVTPGTVDVDLNVEDTYPLHGSFEVNNRYSPSTTPLRMSATLRYDNLWQAGHSISATYQEAPLRPKDSRVFSASYVARTPLEWMNFLVYGLNTDSDVATVGGANVIGPGHQIGMRTILTLPSKGELFHTLSVGADYKSFGQIINFGSPDSKVSAPIEYVPLVTSYNASFIGEGRQTTFDATFTAGLRGPGSETDVFDNRRFKGTANFVHVRLDLSHTHEIPGGGQFFAKIQGQAADQPLVSSEQYSIGGLDTVRGYAESEVLGDYGFAGTIELRSPNLGQYLEQKLPNPTGEPVKFNAFNDWRFFVFADGGRTRILNPLPEQQAQFDLASYGIGTRIKFLKYFNGLVLVGMPLISQQQTQAHDPHVKFRVWGEF
ncbi:MAG: ShlB/FhaC/HecB family hemolysin secretion/activation protein [Bradyrhizobium sp.]|nr:ShlB/FhaC/HecB family hemolysin secretion/activation protein [Bradyrhizobium sp.]